MVTVLPLPTGLIKKNRANMKATGGKSRASLSPGWLNGCTTECVPAASWTLHE